jgi:hypothetical protein
MKPESGDRVETALACTMRGVIERSRPSTLRLNMTWFSAAEIERSTRTLLI